MKTATVYKSEFLNRYRLDSVFYLSEGNTAIRLVDSALKKCSKYYSLKDKDKVSIWQPNRNVLVYAGDGEKFAPYLQPYDILEFLPEARSKLSVHQNELSALHVSSGTILQTCSGRNLGPLIIADKYLEQFVFGSDLIRIDIHDLKIRFYIFAFLNTWIGQALLHSNKTGSVIDHLSAQDIEKINIPIFSEEITEQVSALMGESFKLFSEARTELSDCKNAFIARVDIHKDQVPLCTGWRVQLKELSSGKRLDAAYYDPMVLTAANNLKLMGGCPLNSVAKVFKPSGRYKTNYVEKDYGHPLLSGRQLLQNQIVGLKYLPRASKNNYSGFLLKKGCVVYPADGRVEGRLGTPVLVTPSREGWYASGHIGRIEPLPGIDPGYLYLALSHPVVQEQISSLACGSVVDAVYPEDVEKIIIPAQIEFQYNRVVNAWNKFDEADALKQKACKLLLTQFGC